MLHNQGTDIWCTSSLKLVYQTLIMLRLKLIYLILSRLHFLVVDWATLSIHTVDKALLKLNLLVGHLILAAFTVDKWLVHAILVV